jgi:hypothetical protein
MGNESCFLNNCFFSLAKIPSEMGVMYVAFAIFK